MAERGSGKVYPWRRYFARWLDLNLYGVIGQALTVLVFHMHSDHGAIINFIINWILLMLVLLLIEPLLLSRFGSTVGKALFGIAVCQKDGTHLTYLQGFNRTWDVVKSGMGYMIPVYNVVRMFRCYQLYVNGSEMEWDEQYSYTFKHITILCWGLFFVWIACLRLAPHGIGELAQVPPHRGELTVEEFADNFNYLASYYQVDHNSPKLEMDGTWEESENGEMIHQDMLYGGVRPEFVYAEENGIITGISFVVEAEDVGGVMSPYVMQMNVAALAYAGAQKGAAWNFTERNRVRNGIRNSGFSDFQFSYGGVDIRCDKEYSGYQIASQPPYKGLLEAESGVDNTYYKVVFQMKKK